MRGIPSTSAVVIGSLLVSSTVFATTIPLVFQPPPVQTSTTNEFSDFDNFYTFTLSSAISIVGLGTIVPVPPFSSYSDGLIELFSGIPNTGTPEGPAVAITGPSNSGSIFDSLGPGEYYFEVSADVTSSSGVPVVNVLSIVTIPELPTWSLLGLGFAALGYAGLARRKRAVFADRGRKERRASERTASSLTHSVVAWGWGAGVETIIADPLAVERGADRLPG